MKIKVQCKALSNINYGSNYNEIFENYCLELDGQMLAIVDRQMPAINKLNIHANNKSSSEIDYGDKNDEFFQDNSSVNSISCRDRGNGNS